MGASQSSSKDNEQTFYPPSRPGSVSFSPELLDQLANEQTSTAPSSARLSSLDDSIRAKLSSSLSSLQAEKEALTQQFHSTLSAAPSASSDKSSSDKPESSSHDVKRSIDEVREKIERFEKNKRLEDWPEVGVKKEGVVACYKANPETPLNCWREAEDFRAAVAKLEQHFVSSLKA